MKVERAWRLPAAVAEAPPGFSRIEWAVLQSRGIPDTAAAERILEPTRGPEYDPFQLKDMATAVERIRGAIGKHEPIVVYGDYDADGLTGTALLVEALEGLGAEVRAFIPSRFEEGYGLQEAALVRLHEEGCRLVVSVDCGARAAGEVARAASIGLDVIVTDHHEPGDDLPRATALVNPKQPGDGYPFKGLAGVGLAYKLAQALCDPTGLLPAGAAGKLAIGTIADLAPLEDENRTLVARGLRELRGSPSAGLSELMTVAGVNRRRLTARDVAFGLGPRLNAAGRLGSAQTSYDLLRTTDPAQASRLAEALNTANRDRQEQTKRLLDGVQERLEAEGEPAALIFEASEAFGEGLLGPAAAKLVEEWHRPAVLVALRGDEARGSARSIPGFHITRALEACAPLLSRFGGHEAAAGFSLARERVPELAEALVRVAAEGIATPGAPLPVEIDALVTPDEVNAGLMDFLDRLEPMGSAFPPPLFACLGMTLMEAKAVGKDSAHLRLVLRHPRGGQEAIAFRHGRRRAKRGSVLDVAFYAERDAYLGVETIRWNVQSLRYSSGG